jgi:DNA polymerase II large subunit
MEASEKMQAYFASIQERTKKAHAVALKARAQGYDPEDTVEVKLAANMAERVVGLISVLAPQIVGCGVVERIIELEHEYGVLDWRVALKISEEIAKQQYCTFDDQKKAIEIGVRTGFAYVTVGVVSSPLDGLIDITLKKRLDGAGEYFCLNFAGPIRNAGGTAASVCVIIADYVRVKMGYKMYDATDKEAKRAFTEIWDYIERCAPRQHNPVEEEMTFLMKHMPVEISGDPSERFEVSNYKDLPRIPTNIIRSGFCLVLTDCIPLKAPKLWKQLSKWGAEFDLDHWKFLENVISIQKKAKAKGGAKKESVGISPNFAYVKEIVAGRPVLGYPLEHGAFRLRYGRGRFSGYSAQSMHPATMHVLQDYIATGSQLKTERPGKAASMTMCDSIEGPVVRLDTGDVVQLHTLAQAKSAGKVVEIIYLGDVLVAYGDFFNRAHVLVPPGYCEEWWELELEKAIVTKFGSLDSSKVAEFTGVSQELIEQLFDKPIDTLIPISVALSLSEKLGVSLHPRNTPHWKAITISECLELFGWLQQGTAYKNESGMVDKLVLSKPTPEQKRPLELLGVDHTIATDGSVVVGSTYAAALLLPLNDGMPVAQENESTLDLITRVSPVDMRDRGGVFIGTRMGRPEKAKQRKMTGSPHMSFPVGDEGGRLRCLKSSLEKQKITSDFPGHHCTVCDKITVFRRCPMCDTKTQPRYHCRRCDKWQEEKECDKHQSKNKRYNNRSIQIGPLLRGVLKKIKMSSYPDLIKGVRGTSNIHHVVEHLSKGILRSINDVYTFKDGTTRFDMTQIPMTHFKPKEVGTPIEKLIELGYTHDAKGKPLTDEDQVLEIKPQDVVLPKGKYAGEPGAYTVLHKVSKYVDVLLEKLYGLDAYYNAQSGQDLIGELVICLAPHTSAGMIGRIVGFAQSQGFWAHPYIHAATRRDCDGDESCVILLMDAFLNFSKSFLPNTRGGTMDAPLVLTSVLTPAEVDDMAFDVDIAWRYPLEFYEACMQYKKPWDVKIPLINATLGTPAQFEGAGYTHETTDMNNTIAVSAYKTIPSMEYKLKGQMELAEKIRAVDTAKVATLVIEKHFMRDSLGNLRKFTSQTFRCVGCNEKFRRMPLAGKCTQCRGRIIFTVSKGNILKYVQPTVSLAHKYNVRPYLKQTIMLMERRIDGVFSPEKEKQTGLGAWFG